MHRLGVALAFSCLVIAVDGLTYVYPMGGLNITPWNPQAALEVLFLFLVGAPWMAWVYLTLGVSDYLVRDTPWFSSELVLGNLVLVLGYAGIALTLRRVLGHQAVLRHRSEALRLGVIVLFGTLLTAFIYVSVQTVLGVLATESFWRAVHRFFVGDLLALVVLLPLFFVARDRHRHVQYAHMFRSAWFWGLILLLAAAMGLIFSMSAADRMKYFFALFFVLGLIAATYSLPGATLVAGLIQLLLFVLATHADVNSANLMDMQIVMLMLSLTGLIIGIEVDERLQTQERLRDSLQLVAAGELAGALAHELNQPMSALNAYAESALMLSQNRAVQPSRQTQLEQLLRNIANETVRASDIVKGLRSYFISGVSTLEPMHVQDWVNECVTRVTQNAAQSGVLISTYFEQSTDAFVGDRIQLSTALGNLLKNAIEASGPGMSIKVHVSDNKRALRIRVVDQGPLLGLDSIDRVFRPFYSDKKDGLGLGLSVSQSLVENNGGTLRYLVEPEKCFEILLPLGDSVGV